MSKSLSSPRPVTRAPQSLPRRTVVQILQAGLYAKIEKNPRYSLRAYARDLGVTHAYLSFLLSGKRKLPAKRAIQFCQRNLFEPAVSSELLSAAQRESGEPQTVTSARREKARDEFWHVDLDRFRALSDWYHLAILDLTALHNFKPDLFWIARRLGLKVATVRTAVQRLERLGLLKIEDGVWRKHQMRVEVTSPGFSPAIQNFHRQMIQKALAATDSIRPEDFAVRDITGMTMPINPARIPGAKQRILKFRRSLMRYLTQGERRQLYQLNIQLFALSTPEMEEK